jgi:S1-C subfamily serine protease
MRFSGTPLLGVAVFAWSVLAPSMVGSDDLEQAMKAIVRVRATVQPEATTARTLGTEREGNGILIESGGLILTIGYLILEAERIEVQADGRVLQADFVGYDGDTGFGLVRARGLSGLEPMPLGDSARIEVGDGLHVGGFGDTAQPVRVVARGEFVGYWEYMLDNALYAAPAYRDWGGAALIREGRLVGVGSILTTFNLTGVGRLPCNMFVPIDLLKPILAEMVRTGHSGAPARPWLGLNAEENEGHVVITMVTPQGPAEQAGLRRGDIILAVSKQPVSGLAEFYRRVWSAGPAGTAIRLRVLQGDRIKELTVRSADRSERLRRPVPAGGGAAAMIAAPAFGS